MTIPLTQGVTIYFSKSNDVKEYIVNELKVEAEESNISYALSTTDLTESALISGKSYQIIQKMKGVIDTNDTNDDASINYELLDSDTTITINSTSGVISTSGTEIGLYKLYIRNTGSYHISEYYLFVIEEGEEIVINKEGLNKVLINSLNNGDSVITDGEIGLFNGRYIKINNQYRNSSYINLIRDIHRNEINKFKL
jgi:hypothetical protein